MVEYPVWSGYRVLAICKEKFRDKVHKGLVGVSPLEAGAPLDFKLML